MSNILAWDMLETVVHLMDGDVYPYNAMCGHTPSIARIWSSLYPANYGVCFKCVVAKAVLSE